MPRRECDLLVALRCDLDIRRFLHRLNDFRLQDTQGRVEQLQGDRISLGAAAHHSVGLNLDDVHYGGALPCVRK